MKKIYLLLPLLVFTLLFSSCNKDEDTSPTTAKITVNTTVADYGTVAGVSVTLYKSSDDVAVATKTTNDSGKVVFDNLETNIYYADAEYIDNYDIEYGDDSNDLTVIAGDDKTITLHLTEL